MLDRPFTLGGGLGFGGISFNDGSGRSTSHSGFAYTFRLGFGLRPGLLLLWDVEGTAVPAGATYASASQLANLAALQLFPTRRLFFKGGFGVAELLVENDSPIWGGAAMLGIGYELVQGWNWSFDIEATVTGARYHNSGSDETWTNWSLVNFALNFF